MTFTTFIVRVKRGKQTTAKTTVANINAVFEHFPSLRNKAANIIEAMEPEIKTHFLSQKVTRVIKNISPSLQLYAEYKRHLKANEIPMPDEII